MHSFQPSRGRILFEVLCALAVVSSMVGAWRQTHASALLVAAAAAGLWAMARLFDLGRRQPAAAEEPQRIAFEPEAAGDVQPDVAAEIPEAAVEPLPVAETVSLEPELAEPARAGAGRRKGGSRKASGRRANAKAAEVIELVPAEEAEAAPPADVAADAAPPEPDVAELPPAEDPSVVDDETFAEPAHVPHAPLFEPEPFVRMQRQAFGRRGRI